jgi:pyridoxal phosphate enzyme (YggS family)
MSGRNIEDINIVAVSKKQPLDRIIAALDAGQRLFGENRVQEAYEHWSDLRDDYPDLILHLIGSLQTNKAKEAVALFDCIETIDREKIAKAVADECKKQNRDIECFIQVNTGEEEQKSGVLPHDLHGLLAYCHDKGLNISGLMCLPPISEPPALHFAFLHKLAIENNLQKLSMGMSSDYERAVALGATHIRVGTGLFGNRL